MVLLLLKAQNFNFQLSSSRGSGHYAYNILAALCSANKDEQGCAKYLLIAYQKAPNDSIVILNLANTYRRLGDKKEAERYYKLALASKPPEDIKAEAESSLREINK